MIEEELRKIILEAVSEYAVVPEAITLEHPADLDHGDFATNIAMVLAKKVGENPKTLAEKIAKKIEALQNKNIEKVEVAGAGFINIVLSQTFFESALHGVLGARDVYGKNETLKNKNIIIEYTDPNPFKEFHIGHLMSNAIGESLSRLLEFSGANVRRANYQGDVGLHVAKALWGKIKKKELSWGDAYVYGTKHEEECKQEIVTLNKKIYSREEGPVNELYDEGKKESLEYFEKIYKRLGTHFDEYYFESKTAEVGKKIVEENRESVFEESDGAIVFPAEKYDPKLHTRVFINSEGLPTYEAKDLGLAKVKYDRTPYDASFIITGNEVKEYFKVVYTALGQIYPELRERTTHIPHGMLRLSGGKMSSRTGDVITAVSLLDTLQKEVEEKMKDADIKGKKEVADEIAVGAIKYSILKQSTGKDIIFDTRTALSFEGDSGPYLQYTYARCCALLRDAQTKGVAEGGEKSDLSRLLYRFPLVVERALRAHEPHYVAVYLSSLAHTFNAYYAQHKILGGEREAERIALVDAVAVILKNGLWLLGIKAPERM